MNIDLNLDVELEFDYDAGGINETPGGTEHIKPSVIITSVKSQGIEIISLIPQDTLESMQNEILEKEFNQ